MPELPAAEHRPLSPEPVRTLAAVAGLELDDERAAALVAQAEPHFALLRALDAFDPRGAEPAAELRLDAWRSGHA